MLKRGIYGIYHHIEPKHIGRYVDEFTFRLSGNVKRHRLHRLDSVARSTVGRRITYRELDGMKEGLAGLTKFVKVVCPIVPTMPESQKRSGQSVLSRNKSNQNAAHALNTGRDSHEK